MKKTANVHGSKWIRPLKRLRIYTRDEWRCAYCNKPVYSVALVRSQKAAPAANSEPATLDHVICRSSGRHNHSETNLVTCCLTCNSRRQDRAVAVFAREIEAGGGDKAEVIVKRIRRQRRRQLPQIDDV